MTACSERNTPDSGGETNPSDTTTVTAGVVTVAYNGTSASVTVPDSIAAYLTVAQQGAHVSITQSDNLAGEVTYSLSGSSSDGGFYTAGSYKTTVILNGLTLTNSSAVYSGAAVHVQNGKRIKIKIAEGTTNTLVDAANGSQKGCLYAKGHIEFVQKGTLNVTGKTKHGIKAGEYISVKNATINVLSAVGDGINCEQYFLMESGAITVSGAQDDGIQCDVEDTTTGSTGETTDHEGEDSGNMYIAGGTIRVECEYKGIKAEGDLRVDGGEILVVSTGTASSNGNHGWGGSSTTSSPEGIEAKGTIIINGGVVGSQAADDAINAGSDMTVNGGCVYAYSTSNDGMDANGNCYIKGGLVYAIGARSPEVAIDANTEERKQLYIQGGMLIAIPSIESGASLTQACYQATGTANTWYAMTVGSETVVFKTPVSGTIIVSGATQPALYKGITPAGTILFNGAAYYPATYTGGSSVTLSSYSASSGGGPGGGGRW